MKVVKFDPTIDQHAELQKIVQEILKSEDPSGEPGTIRCWGVVVEREHLGLRWIETYRPKDVYTRDIAAIFDDAHFCTLARLNQDLVECPTSPVDDSGA